MGGGGVPQKKNKFACFIFHYAVLAILDMSLIFIRNNSMFMYNNSRLCI